MTCGITFVDDALNRSFYKLGVIVGRYPGYFIIIPVLLTVICVTGYQQIRYEIDPEYLFSPVRGEGKTERAIVEQYFKVNYTSRFNVARITRAGRFGRVIVTAKHKNDNMLTSNVFADLRLLDEIIRNTTVFYDDEYFAYKDICAKWNGECYTNDILNLDYIIKDFVYEKPLNCIKHPHFMTKEVPKSREKLLPLCTVNVIKNGTIDNVHLPSSSLLYIDFLRYQVENGDLNLTWPVMFNPETWDAHIFPVYFGGSKVVDDQIISVPAIQLVYFINADNKRQDVRGSIWEDAFLDTVGDADDNGLLEYISVARFSSRTLDHELEKNTRTVVPYFATSFLIMALFSVITCMMSDWVRSKPWLGLLGNVSACMATVAAFGAVIYLGVEFIGLNLAAPFLMIGIGIDDTFVMLAAWRRTSIKKSVPDRMGEMLSEAAVSITITSVTDIVSFWIGILSPFRSVQIFCIYSGFAVVFLFVWHLTFFAGCVAVSGYCEKKNLHSVFCFKVLPRSKSENRSWFYRVFCSGGVDPDNPDNPIDNQEHGMMIFFREHFASWINNSYVKALILVIFAVYLAGACYGLTQIKEGLERRKVAKEGSYSIEFFDREDAYFREFPYRIQVIITGEKNYSDPIVQQEIENVMQTLENTSYISPPIYSESWLRSFTQYMERNQDYLNMSIETEPEFIASLKELWLYPSNPFSLDVKFDETGTKIIASRFLIQAVNINDTNHEKEMVRALRDICKASKLNVTVFHPYFVFFDQFELVRPTSIQSMIVGAIIMMLISFIFIPNLLCGIWVAFSIVSIETGVAGYMALWDVNLDSISMINLIMCIGFSVDFTAHICYVYMASKKTSSKERVRDCLYALGLPIVQGSLSTILGVSALIFTYSYIFLVFFKMIFLVIFFGALHGLFLLPVLLSLFGPTSCKKKENSMKLSQVQKALPHPYCIPHPSLIVSNGYPTKPINKNIYKGYGDVDKDLGLGTSGEDSSESSSSKSQRRQAIEDENTRRRYEEGWRRSTHALHPTGPSQFQPSQVMDVYGHEAERAWYRQRSEGHRPRRYSPPAGGDRVAYGPRSLPQRSQSHHNITHPRYVGGEIRFP